MSGPGPYAKAADTYSDRGWLVFPLPYGEKAPPPKGVTGWDGEEPTPDDFTNTNGSNVGLRLPRDVIGLDVDAYNGKPGAETLAEIEAAHGYLPATWRSSSRGVENVSGIRLYRLPFEIEQGDFAENLPGLDLIHFGHRYMVAPPSKHPAGGTYRWHGPNGEDTGPAVVDLPLLPAGVVQHLQGVCGCRQAAQNGPQGSLILQPTDRSPEGQRDRALRAIDSGNNRHDVVRESVMALVGFGGAESIAILEELRGEYIDAVAGDRGGRKAADSEFSRMVDGAARKVEPRAEATTPAVPVAEILDSIEPIDWRTLRASASVDDPWLLEPLIPRKRRVSIVAHAGVGKSLLALFLSASLAAGREALKQPAGVPVHVVYIDAEMTADDLIERMDDLGFDFENDAALQEHLHYYQHAGFPPLDTREGGEAVLAIAQAHGAEVVVIDTLNSNVEGDENAADTFKAYAKNTANLLTKHEIASVSLDHLGKDKSKGARGSSGKRDLVDAQWRLEEAAGSGGVRRLRLKQTKRRQAWIPEEAVISIEERHDGTIELRTPVHGVTQEELEVMHLLDSHEIAVGVSGKEAVALLRATGDGRRAALVQTAQKWRKRRAEKDAAGAGSRGGSRSEKTGWEPAREPVGSDSELEPMVKGSEPVREPAGAGTENHVGAVGAPYRGAPGAQAAEEEDQEGENPSSPPSARGVPIVVPNTGSGVVEYNRRDDRHIRVKLHHRQEFVYPIGELVGDEAEPGDAVTITKKPTSEGALYELTVTQSGAEGVF